jgi:TolB-like protein/tRNA A-37 threonylcarbamoyl transferase component Bud32/tetratricopeptide (TPR) repeat protein
VARSEALDQLQTAIGTQYTLEQEIGRGGMATVYRAHDTKHGRPVAIKVLHAELAASLGPQRFRREIGVAARLQHPHILSVLDSGEAASGQLWFTMMYVDGESLRDRLRREHQLPLDEAVRITREVASALQYAHEHGIVHRDIKPENVLLTTDGSTLVADFGIARALDVPLADTGERLTGRGMVVGTPQYMSPEQAAGERDVGPRSDVYSLGAVAYEMLAGEPPFSGPTAQAAIAKMMSGQAPSVRRSRPAVPEAADVVLQQALAPVPADRFASALEFARALETSARSALSTVTAAPAVARPGRRVPSGALLLLLGLLVGAGALFAWRRQEDRVPAAVASGPIGLAVLPFDAEGDTANVYLADGITDEIRSKLSALPTLQIIARASSNEYRHATKPPEEIGRELGVQYLLTGTVHSEQRPGSPRRVRVRPELIQVAEGRSAVTKWEQSFDTTLADVFDVQSAVASRVADKLGVVLSPPAQSQVAARPTQNIAAYDAYLRSLSLGGNDPPTLRRALALGRQAVALDSGFAAAWAQVSKTEALIYNNSIPTAANAEAARTAADRAVALAPTSPDGYVARAFYKYVVAKDVPGAVAAYDTAVRLAPSSADAVSGLAVGDAAEGHFETAITHARQAVILDPRSPATIDRLCRMLLWVRRYPEARSTAIRGLAADPTILSLIEDRAASLLGEGDLAGARSALRDVAPTLDRAALVAYVANYWDLYWALDSADRALVLTLPPSAFDDDRATWAIIRAQVYWMMGDTAQIHRWADSAKVEHEPEILATPNDFQRHLFHALALAYLGERGAAVREGEHACALAQATGDQTGTIPYCRHVLARLYVAVGDHRHALAQLDTLLAKPYMVSPAWLTIDPAWAPLRGDPHFAQLIAQPAIPPAM